MTDEKKDNKTYYAVVLHPDGVFGVEKFDDIDALTTRLKTLIDHDVSVACFEGARLPISKPPFRHLQTSDGKWLPLFDINAKNLEPDDTGYLGVDPIIMQAPPQIKLGKGVPVTQNTDDEFFDDTADNVLNVFDEILPDPDS